MVINENFTAYICTPAHMSSVSSSGAGSDDLAVDLVVDTISGSPDRNSRKCADCFTPSSIAAVDLFGI
eukprot:COSAG02_NODE_5983_length_3891_cov_1159.797732_1_plen_67_part_10